ncbi:hypothetical protein RvY_07562-3 [Ramazzottius varieornatus]|uniref:HSF-type DNA-binding domain-containing protein n=1 Tax=Ramazzottius varieornatus TaxID=947166 RepID=A0A1D1V2M0_RAMVA|nr:hypothetical protein RvY_07562-3 [Ramazzottius varieornatus]
MEKSTPGKKDIPMFLAKLWNLVEDSKTNSLIRWSSSGTSFVVHDPATFAKHLLPQYFKHRNMASFVRVLNMYEFKKVIKLDSNSLKSTKDEMEFYNPNFLRGHEELLIRIKRKPTSTKAVERAIAQRASAGDVVTNGSNSSAVHVPVKVPEQDLTVVLNDVRALRERQETVDEQLTQLKRENESMYNELQEMRRKHAQQQAVVNKLIEFFITLLHNNGNGPTIRAAPSHLAIQDQTNLLNGTSPAKRQRLNDSQAISFANGNHQGPIIRDVTDVWSPAYSQQEPESLDWDNLLQSNDSTSRAQGRALRELSRALASTRTGSRAPSSPVSMPSPATPSQVGSPVSSGTAPSTSLVPQQALVPLNLTNEQIMHFLTSQGVGGKEQLALERVSTPGNNVEQAAVNSYPVPVVPEVANGNLDTSVSGAQLEEQVDTMQANLDSIRDLLQSPSYQLELNQLLNLFPDANTASTSTMGVPVTQVTL